jgi:hypothetical protein
VYSDFKLIIGGAWRPGKSKEVLEGRNPAGHVLGKIVRRV